MRVILSFFTWRLMPIADVKSISTSLNPYSMNYFIYQNDQERGPYPLGELIKSVNAGYIDPSTMARKEDSDQWMEVSAFIVQAQAEAERLEAERLERERLEHGGALRLGELEWLKTERLERERLERRETEQRKATEKFESPFIVILHYALAGLCFFGSACCLIGVAGDRGENRSGSAAALNLLIIFLSSGMGLFIAGYIINCLAECAFRLRNIEFNTNKATEKN